MKTEEQALFWLMLLVFTQENGKCSVTLIIVHQPKEYSTEIHFNIYLDFKVNHKSSEYMDGNVWIKAETQFSNLCGASPVNNCIHFFGGHNNHFYDRALIHLDHQKIQPFLL